MSDHNPNIERIRALESENRELKESVEKLSANFGVLWRQVQWIVEELEHFPGTSAAIRKGYLRRKEYS